jgi:hypothetical protein
LPVTADDLVIVDLAAENAELRLRVGLTETYREALKVAIEQLAEKDHTIECVRRQNRHLIDENRALRGKAAA